MRSVPVHILLLLVLALACAACSRHGRVIPEEKMVRIYRDMFLADQWVRDTPAARAAADTTYFFDPIFKRYGYSFADYDRSVNYYLDRPEKYARILNKASERLRRENERLNKKVTAIQEVEQERNRLHRLYRSDVDFRSDSLFRDEPGVLWPVPDTLAATDTLAALDSLAVGDTLAVGDSVRHPRPIDEVWPDGRIPAPLKGDLPKPQQLRKIEH